VHEAMLSCIRSVAIATRVRAIGSSYVAPLMLSGCTQLCFAEVRKKGGVMGLIVHLLSSLS
jgi:hypothetical protein